MDNFRDAVRDLALFDGKNWGYNPATNNPSPPQPTNVDGYPGAGTYYLTSNVTPRWLKPQFDNKDGRLKITPRVHRVNLLSAFRPDGSPHILKVRKHFFGCIHGLGGPVQIKALPDAPTAQVSFESGNLNGDCSYKITFVIGGVETEGGPASDVVSPADQQVDLTDVSLGPTGTTARKIYRTTAGNVVPWKLVATLNDNTTTSYTDNVPDTALGSEIPIGPIVLDEIMANRRNYWRSKPLPPKVPGLVPQQTRNYTVVACGTRTRVSFVSREFGRLLGRTRPGAELTIYRLEGNAVPEDIEDTQGSIVNVVDPFRDEELGDPPNNRLRLVVNLRSALAAGEQLFLEERGPSKNKGTIRLYQNETLIKEETQTSVRIDGLLVGQTAEFQVEAVKTGVTDLALVVKAINGTESCPDFVRITGIPCVPASGKIIFVNKQALQHTPLFDDFVNNAALTVGAALQAATDTDNIVVSTDIYYEHDLPVRFSGVIAGLGGNHAEAVETTLFDLIYAPIIDASLLGRVFHVQGTTGEVCLSGITLRNGRADGGGLILAEGEGSFTMRFTAFANGESTAEWPAPEEGDEPELLTFVSNEPNPPLAPSGQSKPAPGGGAIAIRASKKNVGIWRSSFTTSKAKAAGGFVLIEGVDDLTALKNNGSAIVTALDIPQIRPVADLVKCDRCFFKGGSASYGGGAWASIRDNMPIIDQKVNMRERAAGGRPFRITQSTFVGNTCTGGAGGGAIWLYGSGTIGSSVEGCTLQNNNSARDGGAIMAVYFAGLNILPYGNRRTVIENNSAGDDGGGVYASVFSIIRMDRTSVIGNKVTTEGESHGGGVALTGGSVGIFTYCDINENTSVTHGGGLSLRNSRADVHDSSIKSNRAKEWGGGVATLAQDDAGGKQIRRTVQKGITFTVTAYNPWAPTAVNPSHVRLLDTVVESNASGFGATGPAPGTGGGIAVWRAPNRPISDNEEDGPWWVDVNGLLLRFVLQPATLKDNSAVSVSPATGFSGVVGGIALKDTDESAFTREAFTGNLVPTQTCRECIA